MKMNTTSKTNRTTTVLPSRMVRTRSTASPASLSRRLKNGTRWNASLPCLVLLLAAGAARAVDYHVATAQQLQNALTLAAASSTNNNIYVTNGYYTGNFNFNSANVNSLTILNETNVASSQIVIDSGGTGSSMNIIGSASSNITVQGMTFLRNCGSISLAGLRIAGGNTAILVNGCSFLSPTNSSGIGLMIVSGISSTVTNCNVAGSTTGGVGLGISISGISNAIVQNCTITTNKNTLSYSQSGGGLSVSGATNVAVTSCILAGNLANNGYGCGAYCSGTTIAFIGNTFIGNGSSLAYGGGGAFCSGNTITLSGNTFTGNTASSSPAGYGGGAYCSGNTITLSSNTFTSNLVFNQGGGAYCSGAIIILSGNTFANNSSIPGNGGGAYCSGQATLTSNIFSGNGCSGSGGGAYCFSSVTNPSAIYGNSFQLNTAVAGGGLFAYGPNINLMDNLVVNNSVTNNNAQGGGIYVDASAKLNMINNTLTGNTSANSGGGVAYIVTGTVELLNVYNNIIWGNLATVNGGDVYLSGTGKTKVFNFNDADSYYGVWDIALNDIDVSPQFFNAVGGDYHLHGTSPCANAGTNGAPSLPLTDLDGNSRTNSAGLVDLGCYEFNTTATHPADTNADFVMTVNEYNAYAAAWKAGQTWTNGPNPGPNPLLANYVTRAGYLALTNSGIYTNSGSARPTNWKPPGP